MGSILHRLLFSIFIRDGKNVYRSPSRSTDTRSAPYVSAHFMMSGGNILALQKILGHHDIKMTMRYAHLAPDHLETALRFNPLATLPNGDKVAAAVGITP